MVLILSRQSLQDFSGLAATLVHLVMINQVNYPRYAGQRARIAQQRGDSNINNINHFECMYSSSFIAGIHECLSTWSAPRSLQSLLAL
jgi:hypothetical protein